MMSVTIIPTYLQQLEYNLKTPVISISDRVTETLILLWLVTYICN